MDLATLKQVTSSFGKSFNIDFSVIPSSVYRELFFGLLKYGITEIEDFCFNCDTYYNKGSFSTPTNTIFRKNRKFVENIIQLLKTILPKSRVIKKIVFSNIDILPNQLEEIAVAMASSQSVDNVGFSHISIGDTVLHSILSVLNPNMIKVISFTECGISQSSLDAILGFLKRKNPSANIEVLINDSAFPESAKRRIYESTIPEINIPIEEELPEELIRLRKENTDLKEKIKTLKELKGSVSVNQSLFVVGKKANEFVSYLEDVERKMIRINEMIKL